VVGKHLYRYESKRTTHGGGLDVHGEYDYSSVWQTMDVVCDKYLIYKETEKGYWIDYDKDYDTVLPNNFELESGDNFKKSQHNGNYRFVLKHTDHDKKRFAYDTKEKALQNFIIRKTKHKRYLQVRVNDLEHVLGIAKLIQDQNKLQEA